MYGGYVSGAGAFGQAHSGILHLARACLVPKLQHRFMNHADTRRAKGMAHGQQAAVGVGGYVSGQGGSPVLSGPPGFAKWDQVQSLELLQFADGGRIVHLDQVYVLGLQSADLVGFQSGGFGAVGAEGRMVAAFAVVATGGEHRGGDAYRPILVDTVPA